MIEAGGPPPAFPRRASRASIATPCARKGSLVDVLARFARREIDVLVGTQMIAKGHDFPHVTLVGVVSADVGLGLADFRAAERTFQLLTQVAGRAGRGDVRGRGRRADAVPDALQHPPRLHAGLPRRSSRRRPPIALAMRYPPHVAMVNVVVKGRTFDEAMDGGAEPGRARFGRGPQRLRAARAGAGAADPAARRASRAVLPEGHEPRRDARGAARARSTARSPRLGAPVASVDVGSVTECGMNCEIVDP